MGRFVFSWETKKEFNLKESDIPAINREEEPDIKNHVQENKQVLRTQGDLFSTSCRVSSRRESFHQGQHQSLQ